MLDGGTNFFSVLGLYFWLLALTWSACVWFIFLYSVQQGAFEFNGGLCSGHWSLWGLGNKCYSLTHAYFLLFILSHSSTQAWLLLSELSFAYSYSVRHISTETLLLYDNFLLRIWKAVAVRWTSLLFFFLFSHWTLYSHKPLKMPLYLLLYYSNIEY